VYHDITKVHQDPLRGVHPFDAERACAMPREDLVDVIGDRLHLTLGLARAEHQVISDRGKLGDVENEDVFGLLFQGRRGDGDRFGLRLRYDRFPPGTT
jgi:hypothetical protein